MSTPLSALDVKLFTVSYASARHDWLARLPGLPCPCRHIPYPCPGQGPDGETLSTDTAWLGPEQAAKVLVLLAGTHGIEGFAGSAIQLDLMHLLALGQIAFPDDAAVLLVHALTPWGYAWRRRCDDYGVDLNRNAVDFSIPLPENPGYEQLRPSLQESDAERRWQVFAEFTREHGREAFETAISAGQYSDPTGPFYGGQAPAHGLKVCADLIQRYALAQRDLAVIDLHTGLGPYGYGEIICDHTPDSHGAEVARTWYGDSVTLPLLGTSTSVPKLGLLDYAWHRVMNERSCYVTLEFGTYGTRQLFEVLLADHRLWARPENLPDRSAHAAVMLQHFCPDDPAWRELVLFRARQVILQGLRGVAS